MPVIEKKFIFLDKDFKTRDEIFRFVADQFTEDGAAEDAEKVVEGFYSREKMVSTYMDRGICIPHCKSETIIDAKVAIVRNTVTVPWESEDETEQADLMFFLTIPERGERAHLRILSEIAQLLLDEVFVRQVREAKTAEEVMQVLEPVNQIQKGGKGA